MPKTKKEELFFTLMMCTASHGGWLHESADLWLLAA